VADVGVLCGLLFVCLFVSLCSICFVVSSLII